MNYDAILQISPYSLDKEQKRRLLTTRLVELTRHHRDNCKESLSTDETYTLSHIRIYK